MPRQDATEYQLDPSLDFLRLLWEVEHGLRRASKLMRVRVGITGPQRLVLRMVATFRDLSAGDLAKVVRLHPSTITGIVQRLVDRGLLARDRHPDDSRRVRLRVKPPAQLFTRLSRGTIEEIVTQTLSQLPDARVKAAQEVLSALAAALRQVNERPRATGRAKPSQRRAGSAVGRNRPPV